ncbi:MAG: hypothetical protein DHS20C15_06260 [Planctomycetota bacterium]|nr:MAG: hypothetical protein DHS20C15_06260 [Planctomycetota bacterium]
MAVLLAVFAVWLLLDETPTPNGGSAPLAHETADSELDPRLPAELGSNPPRGERSADPMQLPDSSARLTRASGRVVSRAGTPLADARVLGLIVPVNLFAGPPQLSGQETRTDSEGRFELLGLPTNVKLAVDVDAPGYAPTRKQGFRLAEGEARNLGTITLDTGLAMVGEVRDEFGTPLAGALIRVDDVERVVSGDEEGAFVGETLSDDDGWYRVPNLARRQYEITASLPGHATTSAQITFVLGQEVQEWTQDFVLETTNTVLAGWVLNPSDEGVADATLHLSRRSGGSNNSYFRTSTVTDADGNFRFEAVPDGQFELSFEAAGWYLPSRRKLESGRENHELRVQAAIRVFGELSTEGPPAPTDFSVRVRPDASTGAGLLPGARHEQKFHTPDAPGRFTLDGLKPGAYTFEVLAPGFALSRGTQLILGVSQREADLRIPLRTGGSLRGRLSNATADAKVELRSADWDPGLSIELAFPTPALPGLSTHTNAEGEFAIQHVPEGLYVVSASPADGPATHLREVQVFEGRETDLGLIRLARSGKIRGQVFGVNGAPAAGARLTLSGDGHFQQLSADGDGFYEFSGVPEGYAEVTATPPGLWDALRSEARGEVRVDPERPAQLDLQLAARAQNN